MSKFMAFSNGVSTNDKARSLGTVSSIRIILSANFSLGRSHQRFATVILCFVAVCLFVAQETFALTPAEGEPLIPVPIIHFQLPSIETRCRCVVHRCGADRYRGFVCNMTCLKHMSGFRKRFSNHVPVACAYREGDVACFQRQSKQRRPEHLDRGFGYVLME